MFVYVRFREVMMKKILLDSSKPFFKANLHCHSTLSDGIMSPEQLKSVYKANGYDIALVQRLLQHSSAATTQRYIGIEPQRIEQAIQNHAQLL